MAMEDIAKIVVNSRKKKAYENLGGLLVSLILWNPLSTNTTEKDPQEQREP